MKFAIAVKTKSAAIQNIFIWERIAQKMNDAVEKLEMKHGIEHFYAKLNDEKVREIRAMYSKGTISMQKIANLLGVSLIVIWKLIRGKTWKSTLSKFMDSPFYDLRHATIFETMVEMYDKREPIDIITLQQKLKDQQLLEQIGGIAYLSQLQDSVPSAANLSYYLEIVQEKFLLRRMIATCTEVVGRVYDYEGDVETLLDEVEKEILRINESRAQSSTCHGQGTGRQGDSARLKIISAGKGTLNGLATGFPDLDRMTDGLHGQEMIVIAARPSHGQDVAGDEHRRACRAGAKFAGGRVQPGNERGIAGAAHDVLDRAGEPAEHPRRVHERGGFSEADERGGPAGVRDAVD